MQYLALSFGYSEAGLMPSLRKGEGHINQAQEIFYVKLEFPIIN